MNMYFLHLILGTYIVATFSDLMYNEIYIFEKGRPVTVFSMVPPENSGGRQERSTGPVFTITSSTPSTFGHTGID